MNHLGRPVAPLAGSAVGMALIARHGSQARRMAIPFGPLGGVAGLLVGSQLIDLYLGLASWAYDAPYERTCHDFHRAGCA